MEELKEPKGIAPIYLELLKRIEKRAGWIRRTTCSPDEVKFIHEIGEIITICPPRKVDTEYLVKKLKKVRGSLEVFGNSDARRTKKSLEATINKLEQLL